MISNDFDNVFKNVDLLITPACFHQTLRLDQVESKVNTEIFDEKDFFTASANIAGVPAITVPANLCSSTKLPVAIQLIANHNKDELLLNSAQWFLKNNQNNFSFLNKF
jgi:aspartyl-tRNA(Asn)/glutamyl-tRNA(Gln) amidotransferase subunit A